jgi:ADP-ribose pyrophosphatase YjhB (NUDIX family)
MKAIQSDGESRVGKDNPEDCGGKGAVSGSTRIRVCLAVVENDEILLVPHYKTDAGDVQWVVPGGKVEFCESLQEAASREFLEETGLAAQVVDLLHVSEVILPERPYHSVTISFLGIVKGGMLRAEADHPYGTKVPRWFSATEVKAVKYHPERTVEKALNIDT